MAEFAKQSRTLQFFEFLECLAIHSENNEVFSAALSMLYLPFRLKKFSLSTFQCTLTKDELKRDLRLDQVLLTAQQVSINIRKAYYNVSGTVLQFHEPLIPKITDQATYKLTLSNSEPLQIHSNLDSFFRLK